MTFQTRYQQLNKAQKEAVDTTEGPVMVVAGPGTGKTELLSVRVANILKKTDTLPENILLLTFTDSGALAMRERLVGIIGKDAYKVAIHTFHSFGSEVMGRYREHFYRSALFEPADELKQYEIMREIFESLAYGNPLATTMNGEYTHLNDAKRVISELKRSSALTSDELLQIIDQSEAALDILERFLGPIFAERVSKDAASKLFTAVEALKPYASAAESLYEVPSLLQVVYDSLLGLLEAVESVHPTKPITAWKAQWLERDAARKPVFKSRKRLAKLKALAPLYYEYLTRMEKQNLYDFDDMIMQVVHALEVNDELRFNLQEKYLYVMVDEFQDTNLAQLRILRALTDNPVNEGAPNMLVVGDDDQAIYGFQGADISNILGFSALYPTRKLVVLTENYRSEAPILEAARAVITQGGDRLERRLPELNKQLHAHKQGSGAVTIIKAPSIDAERSALVHSISARIAQGAVPASIAVLARRHSDIQSLLPYFTHAGIAVRYEHDENVLDLEPLVTLEAVSRLVLALAHGQHDEAEMLLPEVLAHPAWAIEPEALWQLSLTAYETRQHWMSVMATTPRFVQVHQWLTRQAQAALTLPLEPIIDQLIGSEGENPYFRYFFSEDARTEHPTRYIEHLEALRVLRAKLREYRAGESLSLDSFIDFVDLHRALGLRVSTHHTSLAEGADAVQLLTAHKSKGLEFDTVYVFNSVDNAWGHTTRTMSRLISYPENLPLEPAGNTVDERLRLYYVAMTRAKSNLILSYSDRSDTDKQTLLADFLIDLAATTEVVPKPSLVSATETAQLAWYQPLVEPSADLHTLLAPRLATFKLSATSLNAFLDVSRGGPQAFLLNNLLHFPKAKPASAAYGTAIHRTMQQLHTHLAATGEQKPLEDSLHDFEVALEGERLSDNDYEFYLKKGSEDLPAFLTSGVLPLTTNQKAEVGFSHQGVQVGDARLTGSLDMIEVNEQARTLVVTDYKTGSPALHWDKGPEYTKLKLHKYKQQLLFYKILAEHSSAYGNYTVTKGQLAFIEPTKAGESVVLGLDLTAEDVQHTTQLIAALWKRIQALDLPDTSAYSPDLRGVLAFEQDLIDEVV